MAMHYLGDTLDIHTGGVDNMFPHHTNEIAQSEGATGEPFARYWLHAAHLLVDGGKMSKSLGNCYTIPELVELGYAPSAIRYLLLSGHYRTQLNFTFEGLEKAGRSLDRLEDFSRRLAKLEESGLPPASEVGLADIVDRVRGRFEAALDDDLNVSEALAAVFTLVREGNQRLDEAGDGGAVGIDDARDFLGAFDGVFGVLALREGERRGLPAELQDWVLSRIADREAARRAGDYERADLIRSEVEAKGILLEDTPDGTHWKPRAESASTGDS
jgi:cysteinyl-tRNA synthetase